jgi:hypothetical protein
MQLMLALFYCTPRIEYARDSIIAFYKKVDKANCSYVRNFFKTQINTKNTI